MDKIMKNNNVISLFAGCGGLDLGFSQAGFNIVWANEYDKSIWETYKKNHTQTKLDTRSITDIQIEDIPDCIGVIGGPPCQSWSEAGAQRGIQDPRGQLFYEYIRVLEGKQPLFFLAENVSGMLAKKHRLALDRIIGLFDRAGYNVKWKLLNVKNYNVPQDRKRVIFLGYRKDLGFVYEFPKPAERSVTIKEAIWDLRKSALPALEKNHTNPEAKINHEYMNGGFSTIYMSRNRVRGWDQQSFTIQAGGRHAPIHPQANKMIKLEKDKFVFDPESEQDYRRLSVRECARIQTFPDDFEFVYNRIGDAYKMIGNAVPVNFAKDLGEKIYQDLEKWKEGSSPERKPEIRAEQLSLGIKQS